MEGSGKVTVALVALAILVTVVGGGLVRHGQLDRFEPADRIDGEPAPTTLDAHLWLRYAEGDYTAHDELRAWPEGKRATVIRPMLSWLLTFADPLTLVPLLSTLFAIPLLLYFHELRLPAAGLVGAWVGTLSVEYFTRTSLGRIDTDLLILFFPLIASLSIYRIRDGSLIVGSALAGLSMLLFHWWYFHSGFQLVYLATLVGCLWVWKKTHREIAIAAGIYALCANPYLVLLGVKGLLRFATKLGGGGEGLGETMLETRGLPFAEIGGRVLETGPLAWVGLVAFFALAIRRWRHLLPLSPLVVLGFLAPFGGARMTLFLGPWVGVGFGYLLHLGVERIVPERWREVTALGAGAVLIAVLWPLTAADHVPRPRPSAALQQAIAEAAEAIPAGSPVISWWDHGYLIQRAGRAATLHDGGAKARTREIARALVGSDPQALLDLVKGEGYLLLDRTLVDKYAAIDLIARGSDERRGYQQLDCTRLDGPLAYCGARTINLQTGEIDATLALEQLVVIRDGKAAGEQLWQRDTDVLLQMTMDGNRIASLVLTTEPVQRSLFNRLFVLGETPPGVSLVHDGPDVRVWRLDQG